MNFFIRLWVVLIAVLLGFILYVFAFQPLLTRLGFLETEKCLIISYQQYQNSVLVHTLPLGLWVWFDGKNVFVYGLPTGRLCQDAGFEPAYMIDTSTNEIIGWTCTRNIEQVSKFYQSQPIQYLIRPNPTPNFDIYDLINLLADQRIITIKGASSCSSDAECGSGGTCQGGLCVMSS